MNKNTKLILIILGAIIITTLFILGYLFAFNKDDQKTDSENENKNSAGAAEHDWVLESQFVKANIDFEGNTGTLELTNKQDDQVIASPSLYTFKDENKIYLEVLDLTDTDIATTNHFKVTIPDELELSDDSYLGLEIGGERHGGFYTPSALSSLPVAFGFPFPDEPSTIRPTSGTWSFEMSGETGDLSGTKCPTTSGGFSSGGEAELDVSSHGLYGSLDIDGQNIFMNRVSLNDTDYDSGDFSFTTFDENNNPVEGTATYDFEAIDQEHITGEISWDNMQGCTGTYPFSMELLVASETQPYVPKQGMWDLDYMGPFICGGRTFEPGLLPSLPNYTGMMSVTGGGPLPLQLSFSAGAGSLNLMQNMGTNFYNPYFYNMFFGIINHPSLLPPPTPPLGPTIYSGTYEATAISETYIIGVLHIQCLGGVSGIGAIPFQMNFN